MNKHIAIIIMFLSVLLKNNVSFCAEHIRSKRLFNGLYSCETSRIFQNYGSFESRFVQKDGSLTFDPNEQSAVSTPLIAVINDGIDKKYGHDERKKIIIKLLDAGADPNIAPLLDDASGTVFTTALIEAAQYNTSIVDLLLRNGAQESINQANASGETPLSRAIHAYANDRHNMAGDKHVERITLLVACEAEVENTSLQIAHEQLKRHTQELNYKKQSKKLTPAELNALEKRVKNAATILEILKRDPLEWSDDSEETA